jgi:hypothetical protein
MAIVACIDFLTAQLKKSGNHCIFSVVAVLVALEKLVTGGSNEFCDVEASG